MQEGVGGLSGVVVSPTKELNAQTVRVFKRVFGGLGLRHVAISRGALAGADLSKVIG